jgi:hypothetical protein
MERWTDVSGSCRALIEHERELMIVYAKLSSIAPLAAMPTKIIKFIPSRIGEPLTAFYIHQDMIAFGSVSGYMGLYLLKSNKVKYDTARLYEVTLVDQEHY